MKKFINNIFAIKGAFFYSISGIRYLMKERAFRQELGIGIILIIIESFRNNSHQMALYLFSSYILILILEAVNSAIEATIDRISLEKHELSKKAKDIGSSFVFIAMVHFGIVWLISWIS